MKTKILCSVLCMLPVVANAEVPYRTEQIEKPVQIPVGYDDQALARLRRFYVGGMYDLTVWNDGSDGTVSVAGKTSSSFEVVAGIRVFDIFRTELNYVNTNAKWDAFELSSQTAMLNLIIDARINNMFRLFYKQRMVPYVGIGAGAAWNSADGTDVEYDVSAVVSALAGLSVELGEFFALDFGYRYMYMFAPKIEMMPDFAPIGHQFRVGARIHF